MVGQARPTTYKGIDMRSRLEAAYAQELDSLGLEWVYEPQVFANETGQYLPDFLLGHGGVLDNFVETKPESISQAEVEAAMRRMHIIRSSLPKAILVMEVGTWRGGGYQFKRRYTCNPNIQPLCPICEPNRPSRGPATARAALGSRARGLTDDEAIVITRSTARAALGSRARAAQAEPLAADEWAEKIVADESDDERYDRAARRARLEQAFPGSEPL